MRIDRDRIRYRRVLTTPNGIVEVDDLNGIYEDFVEVVDEVLATIPPKAWDDGYGLLIYTGLAPAIYRLSWTTECGKLMSNQLADAELEGEQRCLWRMESYLDDKLLFQDEDACFFRPLDAAERAEALKFVNDGDTIAAEVLGEVGFYMNGAKLRGLIEDPAMIRERFPLADHLNDFIEGDTSDPILLDFLQEQVFNVTANVGRLMKQTTAGYESSETGERFAPDELPRLLGMDDE